MSAIEKNDISGNLYDRWFLGRYRWWSYHNKKMMKKMLGINFLVIVLVLEGLKAFANDGIQIIIVSILISVVYCEILTIGPRYKEGYQIKKNELVYYRRFIKRKISYTDIENIIISYAYNRGFLGKWVKGKKRRFVPYPWLSLCGKEFNSEKLLKRYDGALTGVFVDNLLKKEDFIYSFCWNFACGEELLKNFHGNYYISNAIAARYRKEISELIKKYNVDLDRIHIVEDVEITRFLWKKY